MARIQNRSTTTQPQSIDSAYFSQPFLIDATILAAKQLQLPSTPTTPSKVRVSVNHGPEQVYNTDFVVTGDIVSWDGLGIETGLTLGDYLIITYVR